MNKLDVVEIVSIWILILLAVIIAGGCTIAPKRVENMSPSFDNGRQNSGFYGWGEHEGQRKGLISSHALRRYNGLIKIYGDRYPGGMESGVGISPGYVMDTVRLYWISKAALVRFVEMQGWARDAQIAP